tara:strand:- start:292 stop:747 length:456 start_codon:yes stop_codon:yes gene_type:complete
MSKPFKMRSGNSPIFKLMGASPIKQFVTLTDEQISDYLGKTKRDIRKDKKKAIESADFQKKSILGSKSGKTTNINLNPLSIIDPYGPLSGKGHFGITTSKVQQSLNKPRKFKKRIKDQFKEKKRNIKLEAKQEIQDRKRREYEVKKHYQNL